MSLATQCPHCRTKFKVANDQLKLQAGLVRCGICQQIFNGIEQLVDVDKAAVDTPAIHQIEPLPVTDIKTQELASLESSKDSAELAIQAPTQAAIPIEASEDGQQPDSDIEQLSFIRQGHTQKRVTRLLLVGSVALLFLLFMQLTYIFRDIIAAAYPASKKTLVAACHYLGCKIQLPAQLEELSYEAEELHTLPREHTFELSLLLRNHSALTQAWPYLELTLKNPRKQTVLRRVFTPDDYLSDPNMISTGFLSHQEYAINLYFEISSIQASDYAVAIFYP